MSLRAALLAVAGTAITTFALLPEPPAPVPPEPLRTARVRPPEPTPARAAAPASRTVAPVDAAVAAAPPAGNAVFRFDAQGRVLLDAAVAEHLERLLEDVDGAQRAAAGLPPAEAMQARRIASAYGNYLAARGPLLAGPPMDQPVAAARRRHDELIALRRQLFGADDAARLFGEEEARTRRELDAL